MAALILGALAIGFVVYFVVGDGPLRVPMLTIHKSLGMTALILGALRIVYRLSVGAPPYAVPLGRLIHKASQAGHLALYALMLATPIVGYIASSAGGYEISWFGLFDFPGLAPRDHALMQKAIGLHFWLGWAIASVLAIHIAAVFWHACVKRDEVLSRMWPSSALRQG
jgi:cytochrome b561